MKKNFCALFLFVLFSVVFAEDWYVCIGSFFVKKNAVNLCNELEMEGFQSFIEPATSKTGGQLYRVMIGEPSKSQADARDKRDEFSRSDFARRKNITGAWICQAPVHSAKLSNPKPPVASSQKVVEQKKNISVPKTEERVQKNTSVPAAENAPQKAIVLPEEKEVLVKNDDAVSPQTNAPVQEEEQTSVSLVEESVALNPVVVDESVVDSSENSSESNSNETVVVEAPVAPEKPAENSQKPSEITLDQTKVFDEEIDALSQCVSKSVKICLDRFPANKNFSLETMKIFDVDHIRKTFGDFDKTSLIPAVGGNASGGSDSFVKCIANVRKNSDAKDGQVFVSTVGDEISKSVDACAFATYQDNANKSVEVFVAVSEASVFELPESDGSDAADEKKDFLLRCGTVKSVISKDGGNYILTASTEDKRCFLKIKLENFTTDDLTAFMENYNSESLFSAYPQIQNSFGILPEDTSCEFLCYDIEKIGMGYVEERGFVEWSMKMLDLYNASVAFNYGGKNVEVSIFDFGDEYNASDAYVSFKDEQNKTSAGESRSRTINGTADGFLQEEGVRELSFVENEKIISINCDLNSTLHDNELQKIATSLKLWD